MTNPASGDGSDYNAKIIKEFGRTRDASADPGRTPR